MKLWPLAVVVLALAVAVPALAEEEEEALAPEDGWQIASDINLTLTQNAYSDNWDGGETGALSWALNSNTLAESQLTTLWNSKNTLKLAFGQTHSQNKETKRWAEPATTTDLIDFESVLRMTHGWAVDPFVSGRIESRFLDTRDPAKKRTFNPVLLTESVGVARVFIKDEHRELSTRLGGAVRQHIDREVLAEGATERETVTTNDAGMEFVAQYRGPLAGDAITLKSDLKVFQAFYYSESDALEGLPNADDWKSPDVNWENTFTAGITDYLDVNLVLQLLYDKETDDGARLKETLSLGFTFELL
jgi:hypothetical protein